MNAKSITHSRINMYLCLIDSFVILHLILGNEKGVKPFGCLFSTLVPPSNHTLNKQEQFTPSSGREPSELLALSVEFGGFV